MDGRVMDEGWMDGRVRGGGVGLIVLFGWGVGPRWAPPPMLCSGLSGACACVCVDCPCVPLCFVRSFVAHALVCVLAVALLICAIDG